MKCTNKAKQEKKTEWITVASGTFRFDDLIGLRAAVSHPELKIESPPQAIVSGLGHFSLTADEYDFLRKKRASSASEAPKPGIQHDPTTKCPHERLTEEGICRTCGADRRGI